MMRHWSFPLLPTLLWVSLASLTTVTWAQERCSSETSSSNTGGSCTFRDDWCGWDNNADDDLDWEKSESGGKSFLSLNVRRVTSGKQGKLVGPSLCPTGSELHSFTFRYYVDNTDRCRLSLYLVNSASNISQRLWQSTKGSEDSFILVDTISFRCSHTHFQLAFVGEKLSGRSCGRHNIMGITDLAYSNTHIVDYFDVHDRCPAPSTTSPMTTTTTTTTKSTTEVMTTGLMRSSKASGTTLPGSGSAAGNSSQGSGGGGSGGGGTGDKQTEEDDGGEEGGLSGGAIAGIVVAVIIVVVVVVVVIVCIVLRRAKTRGWRWKGSLPTVVKIRRSVTHRTHYMLGAQRNDLALEQNQHYNPHQQQHHRHHHHHQGPAQIPDIGTATPSAPPPPSPPSSHVYTNLHTTTTTTTITATIVKATSSYSSASTAGEIAVVGSGSGVNGEGECYQAIGGKGGSRSHAYKNQGYKPSSEKTDTETKAEIYANTGDVVVVVDSNNDNDNVDGDDDDDNYYANCSTSTTATGEYCLAKPVGEEKEEEEVGKGKAGEGEDLYYNSVADGTTVSAFSSSSATTDADRDVQDSSLSAQRRDANDADRSNEGGGGGGGGGSCGAGGDDGGDTQPYYSPVAPSSSAHNNNDDDDDGVHGYSLAQPVPGRETTTSDGGEATVSGPNDVYSLAQNVVASTNANGRGGVSNNNADVSKQNGVSSNYYKRVQRSTSNNPPPSNPRTAPKTENGSAEGYVNVKNMARAFTVLEDSSSQGDSYNRLDLATSQNSNSNNNNNNGGGQSSAVGRNRAAGAGAGSTGYCNVKRAADRYDHLDLRDRPSQAAPREQGSEGDSFYCNVDGAGNSPC